MPQHSDLADQTSRAPCCIVLADDHELVREGIAAVIAREPDFTVCGLAGDERTAIELMARHRPDLLLIDLSISRRDDIALLQELATRYPTTRILALAAYAEERQAQRILCLGATGYLIKSASAAELIHALRRVSRGEIYAGPRLDLLGQAAGDLHGGAPY